MNVIQTAATPIIRLERPPELPVPEVKDFFWSVHRAGLEFLDVIKTIDAPDPVRHAEHEVFPLLRSRITNFLPNMPDLEYKLVLKDDLWGLPSGLNSLG